MPLKLKPVIDAKDVFDALPEMVRDAYVERDGKYVLELDGLPPGVVSATDHLTLKSQLAEFRDNNRTMHGELEKLKPEIDRFKDIDPDEYRKLKAREAELEKKGLKKTDDLEGIIQRAVADATKPIADRLAAEEAARKEAQQRADRAQFERLVTEDATKHKVKPNSMRHVIRDADSVFELKDGRLVPRAGQKHPDDPLKELSPGDWLQNLQRTDDYLFEASAGGDARGSGGNGSSSSGGAPANVRELVNPTPEEKGRNAKDIASGKLRVVYR